MRRCFETSRETGRKSNISNSKGMAKLPEPSPSAVGRKTPLEAAGFSMMMLGGTPSGDAYTFSELERMFSNAGFARSEIHPLPPSIEQVVISHK